MKPLKNSIIIVLISLLIYGIVHAQNEELTLKFSRDWGYSSGSGKIQGLFSMTVSSTVPLAKVVFYIDSAVIGSDENEPFKLQFNTDDYSPGLHSMHAIGTTEDGGELSTKEVKAEFVSAQESNKALYSILVPVFGLVLLIVIISAVVPALTSRKKGPLPAGYSRNYGIAGGAICSKCNRPFARHVLALNMLFGKLERCPNCGKWSISRAVSIQQLHEAEEAELKDLAEQGKTTAMNSSEDELNNEIDNTKYQGM